MVGPFDPGHDRDPELVAGGPTLAIEDVALQQSGPLREFLHVDDLADACVFLMEHYSDDTHINVGTGVDCSIRELAEKIRDIVHPEARLVFDTSKPDGTPRKLLDVSRLRDLGWSPSIELDTGIRTTYQWYLEHEAHVRGARAEEPALA